MYASFTDLLAVLYLLVAGEPVGDGNVAPAGIKQQAVAEPSAVPSVTGESTACGDLIDLVNEGSRVLYADEVYACMTSVPFDKAVAQRFIAYYTDSLQFQSTLAYVKKPPQDYRQPAFDVMRGLGAIGRKAAAEGYPNQYEFEADVQRVVYAMHDSHVDLYSGILSAFGFGSPKNLVSVSKDGLEEPKIYLEEHVRAFIEDGTEASPVVSINGEPVIDYLTRHASQNSVGMLEPHADWNQIMYSAAQDITSELNIFNGGGTFYPGDELNFTFADGDTYDTYWLAVYNNQDFTGPLTNGSDFFNYFVLGDLPANYDEVEIPDAFQDDADDADDLAVADDAGDDVEEVPLGFFDLTGGAYPRPDPNVTDINSLVTGYFFDQQQGDDPLAKTGVLSIPSFQAFGAGVRRFSDLVDAFINGASERGVERVVIDLQQNWGGTSQLAFVTFRQFFPRVEPFAGSRRRSHAMADVLGKTITQWWEGLELGSGDEAGEDENGDDDSDDDFDQKRAFAAHEWVVTNRLNAETGKNFSSWAEYFGPKEYNDDKFSLPERYDLANRIFDAAAFDGNIPTQYTSSRDRGRIEPWSAKDIVLLTDGTCGSTCAMFVEMMSQEAGVRTVVIGGRPEPGPMQAASGSRGALVYAADAVTDDMDLAIEIDSDSDSSSSPSIADQLPTDRTSGMYVLSASLNIRDQVRPRDGTPLQFQFLPADCRLYWTFSNLFNMTRLWGDVADAMFGDSTTSLCVEGSEGKGKGGGVSASFPTGTEENEEFLPEYNPDEDDVEDIEVFEDPDESVDNGLQAAAGKRGDHIEPKPCDPADGARCPGGGRCKQIPLDCTSRHKGAEWVWACVGECTKDLICNSEDKKKSGLRSKSSSSSSRRSDLSSGSKKKNSVSADGPELQCWVKNAGEGSKKKVVEEKARSKKDKSRNEVAGLGLSQGGLCVPVKATKALCKVFDLKPDSAATKKPVSSSTSTSSAVASKTKEVDEKDDEIEESG